MPHISRRARWIVPKGVAPLLVRRGVPRERITELSWWDETEEACRVAVQTASGVEAVERTVRLAAVPASHWSARTPLDTNTTLWNSYAVRVCAPEAPDARLFFCGDSGYSASLFQAIGRMYGPFELATIPIGSYEPRWHLSLQHMDPHGSVCVARDVGARTSFGMHWGTWSMSGTSARGAQLTQTSTGTTRRRTWHGRSRRRPSRARFYGRCRSARRRTFACSTRNEATAMGRTAAQCVCRGARRCSDPTRRVLFLAAGCVARKNTRHSAAC